MLTMVLLNVALEYGLTDCDVLCARSASVELRTAFFLATIAYLPFFFARSGDRGPLRVRAFVCVR